MPKLMFKWGTMKSSKSLSLIGVAFNYEDDENRVMLFTSPIDNRSGKGKIVSRAGFERDAILVDDSIYALVASEMPDCVLVDEAQFLTEFQVQELRRIVDKLRIPVICYGLRTDFQGKAFEGSEALFRYADDMERIKQVCKCKNPTVFNMRLDENGNPSFDGEQVNVGFHYRAVCSSCYHEAKRKYSK